jgi:hypothetical protein
MYFKYAVLTYFIFSGIIFAQSYSKASANIKVKLVNGPMFSIVKGDLNFNEYLRSAKGELKIEPPDGILLQVTGIDCSNTIISYGDSKIYKIKTADEKINNLETSEDRLTFQPVIQKTNNLVNECAVEISNVSTFTLNSEKSNSIVNLWIGGSLYLPNSSKDGFYSGTFALSLVYY